MSGVEISQAPMLEESNCSSWYFAAVLGINLVMTIAAGFILCILGYRIYQRTNIEDQYEIFENKEDGGVKKRTNHYENCQKVRYTKNADSNGEIMDDANIYDVPRDVMEPDSELYANVSGNRGMNRFK
ncbi:uncharacterized protein LOC132200536 [Neocloeon triangulifer]|uniref:uncharacterized protein LOC132200536 n=1 Tax=Neocloeon triangulifer TaxID=2078957 RepID=UPI00286F33EB|nr:uncharacterized protein LOC132200536 [Neocloeon triangulifer]